MNNERMPKQIVIIRMERVRKRERQRKLCADEVGEEVTIIRRRTWQTVARDLKDWRMALLEAAVHNEL
jgi:hypothetical protein